MRFLMRDIESSSGITVVLAVRLSHARRPARPCPPRRLVGLGWRAGALADGVIGAAAMTLLTHLRLNRALGSKTTGEKLDVPWPPSPMCREGGCGVVARPLAGAARYRTYRSDPTYRCCPCREALLVKVRYCVRLARIGKVPAQVPAR